MGQIIRSPLSSVCLCVCLSALSRSEFLYFWWNLAQTSGTWYERTLSLGHNPIRESPFYHILPHIGTYMMHFQWQSWNTSPTLSVDQLYTAVQTTSLAAANENGGRYELQIWHACSCTRHDPWKKISKRGVSCYPVNFWALNANSSKTTEDTNFKFGTHAPQGGPDMTPENFFEKGCG